MTVHCQPVYTPVMSKQKTKRNLLILKSFKEGVSIYRIAKDHELSWSRTNRIIQESGVSLLGKRPIAQWNYEASQKRKERRNAKR